MGGHANAVRPSRILQRATDLLRLHGCRALPMRALARDIVA